MLYLGGVAVALFLDLLLFSKKNKSAADKILAGWLFIVTLHLLLFYFHKTGLYRQLLGVDLPLPLAHGPFLYLYTQSLTDRSLSLKTTLLHFIPPMAVLLYIIPFLALPTDQKIWIYEHQGAGYEIFNRVRFFSIIASGVLYVTLSGIALRKHRLSIMNQFSDIEKINLAWMKYMIFWIAAIWIFVIIGNDDWVFGTAVLFILFIGYFGIRQVGIFHNPAFISSENKTEAQNDIEEIPERRKYRKSGLTTENSESLRQNLSRIMQTEKPYRESELSLIDLARRLDTKPNHLSQVINELEGKNFYDYINTLRIEEFMRLSAGPDSRKYTLLALAQECGFNSKSSFNRYFKKVTGKSPSEFLQAVPE